MGEALDVTLYGLTVHARRWTQGRWLDASVIRKIDFILDRLQFVKPIKPIEEYQKHQPIETDQPTKQSKKTNWWSQYQFSTNQLRPTTWWSQKWLQTNNQERRLGKADNFGKNQDQSWSNWSNNYNHHQYCKWYQIWFEVGQKAKSGTRKLKPAKGLKPTKEACNSRSWYRKINSKAIPNSIC